METYMTKFTIEITEPVHSEFLKDSLGKLVRIYKDEKLAGRFVHLEYWGVEELSRNIATAILTMEEHESTK